MTAGQNLKVLSVVLAVRDACVMITFSRPRIPVVSFEVEQVVSGDCAELSSDMRCVCEEYVCLENVKYCVVAAK